jgi:hypothetical protein
VVLIIIDGNKGQGFSVQATLAVTMALPAILRAVADQLEADAKEMK